MKPHPAEHGTGLRLFVHPDADVPALARTRPLPGRARHTIAAQGLPPAAG
ncbi:hypothetical protein [Streptomyces eurythermus]